MADPVIIRPTKNGSYEIKGPAKLVDYKGNEYTIDERPFYLCRCGQSATKPFCDSSHVRVKFKADEMAPKAGDKKP